MGYGSAGNFNLIRQLLGGRSGRICELGDQTIEVSRETADAMSAFAPKLRGRLDAHLGRPMHVRDVYLAAGFDYVSIDVNEKGGAQFVDLNYWPNEARALGTFDVVTNFGTTEHVANQASAFATVHHLLSPGGVAVHEVPIVHCLNHALVNLTPRFLLGLAALNDYTVLSASAQSHCLDRAITFHYGPDILFMQGMREMLRDSTLATLAFIVLRKNSDVPYIPPLDVADSGELVRRLMRGGLDHYNPGISEAVRERAIEEALRRAGDRSCLNLIADTLDTRGYDGRLARTAEEITPSPLQR
jgi:SAM-dependent methyltransferase